MKLEPIKKSKLPKYAAALAVLAATAGVLTGCYDLDHQCAAVAVLDEQYTVIINTEETQDELFGEEIQL